MRLAEAAHPSVLAREAQLAAAEGTRNEAAALLFNNPELSTEAIRRRPRGPDGSWNEWSVGISQPFETGGQRRSAAKPPLPGWTRCAPKSTTSPPAVLTAQQRVQLEQRSLDFFERTAQAVARRAAGEDTRLDANVALLEPERARNALARAGERLIEARSELATAVRCRRRALPDAPANSAPPLMARCRTAWSNCWPRRRTVPASACPVGTRRRRTRPARCRARQP